MANLLQRVMSTFVRKSGSPDWTTLQAYLSWAFGGGSSSSGTVINPQTAMQSGAVFACIKVLAESVAMLPCNLQKRAKGADHYVLADTHPLFDLLHDQPNDYQTSVEFWEMAVLHLCLRGNAYSFINRTASGDIAELLPQHPDTVKTVMTPNYTLQYEIAMADGSYKTFQPGEIFHIRGLTINGWLGISPIAYARESIGLSLAAEKFGGQLFRNGAKMGGVLEHPGKLSEEAYKRVKDSFDAATSGENAHKTALLEEGMKFNKIAMSSEDAQFLETRKYQRSEIASIFRVPPHMIGDLEKATFSNIEQLSLEFVSYSLMPWLTRIEKAVKRDLLTPTERSKYKLKFNTIGLLRGDSKARSEYYKAGINDGWMTRNEARSAESDLGLLLPPLDDLDEPVMPLNMRLVSDPSPALSAPGAKPTPDPADAGGKEPASDETAKAIGALAHAIATQPAPHVTVEPAVVNMHVDELTVKERERKFPALKFIYGINDEIIGTEPVTEESCDG